MTTYMRYRDFIADLEENAEGDDVMRVVENRYIAETYDTWLSLVAGKDGGVAFVRSRRGHPSPTDKGVTVKVEPTVSMTALAAALGATEMMSHARTLLTPGAVDPITAVMFADGLKDLRSNPYPDTIEPPRPVLPPIRKPPSLDADLWTRIPHALRREYLKKMAHGIRCGIHPDDTVTELLAAA
ncbi:hypothetical protein ACQKKX_04445 [Neorhizobium sp. NPDC001467]|uniref:hypothetical protein n=1 Tax=Neorhizobium sp. NPDC001467 TaxID=3390595 RepID=UPI003D052187